MGGSGWVPSLGLLGRLSDQRSAAPTAPKTRPPKMCHPILSNVQYPGPPTHTRPSPVGTNDGTIPPNTNPRTQPLTPHPSTHPQKSDAKRLLALYHDCLVQRPIATKAATSALISALGDLLATWKGGSPRNSRRTLAFFLFGGAVTGPVCHYWYGFLEARLKRLQGARYVCACVRAYMRVWVYVYVWTFVSGCTGPSHSPTKTTNHPPLPPPPQPSNVAAKVFLDKALFTPPFLAVTLFLLRLLESGRPGASLAGARAAYWPALKMNLKVGKEERKARPTL